jgi:hypothetical protein
MANGAQTPVVSDLDREEVIQLAFAKAMTV